MVNVTKVNWGPAAGTGIKMNLCIIETGVEDTTEMSMPLKALYDMLSLTRIRNKINFEKSNQQMQPPPPPDRSWLVGRTD